MDEAGRAPVEPDRPPDIINTSGGLHLSLPSAKYVVVEETPSPWSS